MSSADDVLRGVGRAVGGALLFALPIFLTMEVWRIGTVISNVRLALLIVLTVVVALVLSYYLGFISTSRGDWGEATIDAGVALLVGFLVAGALLCLLSVIEPLSSWRDAVSIVTLEALPATIGASFARSQLGEGTGDGESDPSYAHELFLMAAGAVVFAANIAPTEEVVLVAGKLSEIDATLVVVIELALMHGFVYGVGFRGGAASPDGFWSAFVHFTVVGYVIAFGVSAYLLWSFGRFDGTGSIAAVMQTVVLALPASLGAAAARLIL